MWAMGRRPLGAQEEWEGIGGTQAGGHVGAGDRAWEGEGAGGGVSRCLAQVPEGPSWFFVLWVSIWRGCSRGSSSWAPEAGGGWSQGWFKAPSEVPGR